MICNDALFADWMKKFPDLQKSLQKYMMVILVLQAAALEGDIPLAEQWQRRLAADLEVLGQGMGWI